MLLESPIIKLAHAGMPVHASREKIACEEKSFTEWKQGHTPEIDFETPAFGGGFFLET